MITSTTTYLKLSWSALVAHTVRLKKSLKLLKLAQGKKVADGTEFWVATSRTAKQLADKRGYTQTIEAAGGKAPHATLHGCRSR
jgi:predicted aconitase